MKHHNPTENVKAKIILYDGNSGARILTCPLKGFDEAVFECRRVIHRKIQTDRTAYRRWARSQQMLYGTAPSTSQQDAISPDDEEVPK